MNLKTGLLGTLVAFFSFLISTSAQANANGSWTTSMGGNNILLILQERASGAIIGTVAGQKGTLLTSGSNTASTIVLNLSHEDPGSTSTGTFTGTLSGTTISGNYVDASGSTAVTFSHTSTAYKTETWVFTESTSSATLDIGRVRYPSGSFHSGAYVADSSCSFVGCGGVISSWATSGLNHTIVAVAGGSCTNTTTLTGTFSGSTNLLSGTYSTVDCTSAVVASGSFTAKKAGLATFINTAYFLSLLANFADSVEAESLPSTSGRFINLYMNDGKTKQGIMDGISEVFTDYNSLSVAINGISEIITTNDVEVHSTLLGGPRARWQYTLTGTPSSGGSSVTIVSESVDATNSDFHWLNFISTAAYFSGNGYFELTTPYTNVSDVAAINQGFSSTSAAPWGGIHNGIDFMPISTGTLTIRAPAGGVVYMEAAYNWENVNGWQSNIRINHSPNYYSEFAFETFSHVAADGVTQATSPWMLVSNGDKVEAGDTIGILYVPVSTSSAHVHFGFYELGTASCPTSRLQSSATSEMLGILQATWPTATSLCY